MMMQVFKCHIAIHETSTHCIEEDKRWIGKGSNVDEAIADFIHSKAEHLDMNPENIQVKVTKTYNYR